MDMGLKDVLEESSMSASSRLGMGGIDNVCLNLDNYLDEVEKTLDPKSSRLHRSNSSHAGYNTISNTTASTSSGGGISSHVYATVSKGSRPRDFAHDGGSSHSSDRTDFVTSITVDSETETETNNLQLVWRNITYQARPPSWFSGQTGNRRKLILEKQNGQIRGGQITAIIGPSGAGKSTLLECLAGRRKTGLKGHIYIAYDPDVIGSGVKLSLIGQKDEAISVLTVREVLSFASRIKNHKKITNSLYTPRLVQSILKELSLEKCADTRVSKISGGQLKRLVFGVELISGPDIILLDEPTSGLDSSSAFSCVQLLKRLTDLKNTTYHASTNRFRAPSIICSIHQPSARVLNLFHQIYVLSSDGRCVYQGSPYNLLAHLSKFDMHCPQYHNPSDFVIEIASGDYGLEPINKLAISETDRQLTLLKQEKLVAISDKYAVNMDNGLAKSGIAPSPARVYVKVSKVVARMKSAPFPILLHTWLLLSRTYVTYMREPKLTWFRLLQAVFIGLLMAFLYDYAIGEPDGCFPRGPGAFLGSKATAGKSTEDNVAFIFFITLFTVMASMMPTVLTFPAEVAVLLQERNNGWYSCATYYAAKILADTPIQVIITLTFISIIYPMTGQIMDWQRFGLFCLVSMFISSIAQCVGILFGTYYVRSVENAVFLAPLSMAPVFLLSGFFGKISTIPVFLKPLAYLSYVRYAFEAFLVILYGFDRCSTGDGVTASPLNHRVVRQILNTGYISPNEINLSRRFNRKNITRKNIPLKINPISPRNYDYANTTARIFTLPESVYPTYGPNSSGYGGPPLPQGEGSYVLKHFELTDDSLWQNLIILGVFLLILRILCYIVLLQRTNRRK